MAEEELGRGLEEDDAVAPAGVCRVGVEQEGETIIQEWTQQQVDEGLFEDLSDEQVLEYMVEANTNDEIVHSIQSLG
ncbi:hypothetical protein NW754_010974 [Fusarium falciforme]|nr:hypothetical protein NW754_010974 [Fusarium falciforme]